MQRTVDMAVKLGLRSYALPGTARDYDPESNESLADFVKRQNLGSFTLGPIEVNALELSNVAATLGSSGTWCPPNPIDKVFDRKGHEVSVTTETCEQVVPEGLANTLANAMSKDDTGSGTAAGSAGSVGWNLPMSGKTGTTEAHRSSGFVGFTSDFAAANYIYDDSTTPADLCSFPLRQCGSGDLFGGNEPARTWFTAMKPITPGDVALPPTDPRYVDGAPGSRVPSIGGMTSGPGPPATEGRRLPGRRPDDAGQQRRAGGFGRRYLAVRADRSRVRSSRIQVSNGIPPPPPPPPPGSFPPAWTPTIRTRPRSDGFDGRADPRAYRRSPCPCSARRLRRHRRLPDRGVEW